MTAEGAAVTGQDTPDTAAIRLRLRDVAWGPTYNDLHALCDALDAATKERDDWKATAQGARREFVATMDALDAATARAEAAIAERDRARGTAAALEAQLARAERQAQNFANANPSNIGSVAVQGRAMLAVIRDVS